MVPEITLLSFSFLFFSSRSSSSRRRRRSIFSFCFGTGWMRETMRGEMGVLSTEITRRNFFSEKEEKKKGKKLSGFGAYPRRGCLLTSGWERAWWAPGRCGGSGHDAPARSDQLLTPHWLDPSASAGPAGQWEGGRGFWTPEAWKWRPARD